MKTELSTEALLVCMPETCGQDPIPYAREEVQVLHTLLPESISKQILDSPIKSDVVWALKIADIVHFTCHGNFILDDPSHSHLLLRDWETDLFTVADIREMKLDGRQLAYLSACHGASNRREKLLDEGIHLAGAFQFGWVPTCHWNPLAS